MSWIFLLFASTITPTGGGAYRGTKKTPPPRRGGGEVKGRILDSKKYLVQMEVLRLALYSRFIESKMEVLPLILHSESSPI